nr:immunoglobulin heavy chain junction region [Mus musculus]NSM05959.1 immunoglobulin heavy chain junction region [Mus musculus]
CARPYGSSYYYAMDYW